MIDIQKVIAVLFLCCIAACNSFQYAVFRPLTRKMTTCIQMQNNDEQVNNGMSRRDMIQLATNGIGFRFSQCISCGSSIANRKVLFYHVNTCVQSLGVWLLHCTNIYYNHLSYFKHRKTHNFQILKGYP